MKEYEIHDTEEQEYYEEQTSEEKEFKKFVVLGLVWIFIIFVVLTLVGIGVVRSFL